ncbi:pyridoxal phosphate-dependent aminotransferase [Streptomyces sp. NBC_01235]|uniref:pyridoxal phosphate-dependent aminotransferase n=1 Tax=Streptomyces sp. NBC_01235 TaxID=2903788 RepID=UPI002E0E64FA|nr:aminotransferase class I/II-fold pyridoxal phosphate-dependent enzyme [Streptomyces sp. NBC_01235]
MTHPRFRNSTEIEKFAQTYARDLADGHARHSLHPDTVARLGSVLSKAFDITTMRAGHQQAVEDDFLDLLTARTGETYPRSRTRFLYSASVAIDVMAKFFRGDHGTKLGVITPTFDNIPALLQMSCDNVLPIPEARLLPRADLDYLDHSGVNALLIVNPNNPTGRHLARNELCELLNWAATRRVVVVFDLSFRMLEETTCLPVLDLADEVGAPVATIDDTGKVISMHDTKVSVLSFSEALAPRLTEIVSQYLLNVSAVNIALLSAALDSTASGHDEVAAARALARSNRQHLRARLSEIPLPASPFCLSGEASGPGASMSVEWLNFAELADPLLAACRSRGLELLPGNSFFWESHKTPAESRDWIRVALLRDPHQFHSACDALIDALVGLRPA